MPKLFRNQLFSVAHAKFVIVFAIHLIMLSYVKLGLANPIQKAFLIASPLTKETCGGFDHKSSYVLKSIGYSNRSEVSDARQIFEKELRAQHGSRVKVESVYAGQCLVIARTQRSINGCPFVDFIWRIGVDASSTQDALERDIRGISSSVKDWAIEKVQCVPVRKDTSFGIRG